MDCAHDPKDDEASQKSTHTGQKLSYCLSAMLHLCQFALNIFHSLGTLTSVRHFITQNMSTQGFLLL